MDKRPVPFPDPAPGRFLRRAILLAMALALIGAVRPAEARVQFRLGSLVPNNSAWHLILRKMAADIGKATDGDVRIRVISGGAAGDESEMIRKMRINQLQMVALTNIGVAELVPGALALSLPMVYSGPEEWNHIRREINADFDGSLRDLGLRALGWTGIGWVHFFSTEPVRSVADLRALRMAGATGDPTTTDLLRLAGFDPVPISSVEVVSGFQTGLVEAAPLAVVYAEGSQIYRSAKYMADLPWAPIQGAIIMREESWEELTPAQQQVITRIIESASTEFESTSLAQEGKSLDAMRSRGLEVTEADSDFVKEMNDIHEELLPLVRERLIPPEVFDEVFRLRDAYRAANE